LLHSCLWIKKQTSSKNPKAQREPNNTQSRKVLGQSRVRAKNAERKIVTFQNATLNPCHAEPLFSLHYHAWCIILVEMSPQQIQ
jgi:hypothetical protein